jgi:hypothetical protein
MGSFQAPVLNIIKYKIKHPQVPDPMVMRTIFDSIKTSPKYNSIYVNKSIPVRGVGWELFVLASSLITNQSYFFENKSATSANLILLNYMDTVINACKLYSQISWFYLPPSIRFAFLASLWEGIDPWISSRFSKTNELVSRLAAQLAHIDLTMTLVEKFIVENNISDSHSIVSYERYCDLKVFIHSRCPPSVGVVIINGKSRTIAYIVESQ